MLLMYTVLAREGAKSSARSHEAKGNLSWIEEEGRGRRKEECALCQKAQGKVVLLAT